MTHAVQGMGVVHLEDIGFRVPLLRQHHRILQGHINMLSAKIDKGSATMADMRARGVEMQAELTTALETEGTVVSSLYNNAAVEPSALAKRCAMELSKLESSVRSRVLVVSACAVLRTCVSATRGVETCRLHSGTRTNACSCFSGPT